MKGKGAGILGDTTRINRAAGGFSPDRGKRSHQIAGRRSEDSAAVRTRLIEAAVEVLAEGGDPRLAESRAHP
jgi:hypothetical protein